MAEQIPGLLDLTGDNPTHCPLCHAPVDGNDGLQLHYLTSCKSYDKLSNEQPRSKPRKDPKPSPSSRGNAAHVPQGGVASGGASSGGSSRVQFMWQPLTEITYPTVMLLASFEPGSVTLELDSDGNHYASAKVSIPNGTYEGQLVIGDSFIYPVRKFTVSKSDDIIVLQFDVEQGKAMTGGDDVGVSSSGHYGTGVMHQNPSFGGVSGLGDSVGRSSGISSDLLGGSTGYSYYTEAYQNSKNKAHSAVQPQVTRHTPSYPPVSDSMPSRPPINKNSWSSTPTTTVPDNTTTSPQPVASDVTARSHPHTAVPYTTRSRPVTTTTVNTVSRLHPTTTTTTSSSQASVPTPFTAPTPSSREGKVQQPPVTTTGGSGHGHTLSERAGQGSSGFNVGKLQQTEAEPSTDTVELRQQLEALQKEKNDLQQNQQRVNAQWEGRVKRLETELASLRAGGTSDNSRLAMALQEAQEQITRLEVEVSSLRREKQVAATSTHSLSDLQRQLSEMKDRNTALEQQLMEYAGTITDQSKYIQSSVARSKQQDAETIVSHQDFIHMTAFAKKQQLEHAEALANLEKKISATSDSIDDTRGLHETNIRLAAEIEDYREQTKRLLQDLTLKDEEIGKLKESLYQSSPQGSDQLELATLREKVQAYQAEYDNVATLKNEVELLREQTVQQERAIQRLTSDNDDLTRQFQKVIDNSEQGDPELSRKASEYDTLLDRYYELQQTRVQLENELQPLRQERATTLRENAQLREGNDPQKYARLKKDYDGLLEHCQQLESLVASHEDTNREMQAKLDQTTNPEMLQSIRERMERYKAERDISRRKAEDFEKQLTETDADRKVLFEKLQETTGQYQRGIDELNSTVAKQEAELSRYLRYREERNQYKKKCRDLEKQLSNWRDLVVKSQQLDSDHGQSEYDPAYDSPYPSSDLAGSPTSDYHPQAYTEGSLQQYHRENVDSPMNEVEAGMASLSMEPSKVSRKQNMTGSRPKQVSESHSFEMVDVKTKEGLKVMNLCRPRGGLNAKNKPKVVVKRGEEYEQATLMWVGVVNGKDLAGIQMDCRISKPSGTSTSNAANDGTCSADGKRYFKCAMGYGLYVPLSKVLLEMESAYV